LVDLNLFTLFTLQQAQLKSRRKEVKDNDRKILQEFFKDEPPKKTETKKKEVIRPHVYSKS